jgi:hypothetical protein
MATKYAFREGLIIPMSFPIPHAPIEGYESAELGPNPWMIGGGGRGAVADEGEKARVKELLMGVRGIGEAMAERLYEQGVRLCAQYHEDLASGIDRGEAELLWRYIDLVTLVPLGNRAMKLVAVGSYRRGKEHLKDLDLLLLLSSSSPDTSEAPAGGAVVELVSGGGESASPISILSSSLSKSPLHAAVISEGEMEMSVLMRVKGSMRMVEIRTCVEDEYGAALLAWTGPREYCIGLRVVAEKAGMKLNHRGRHTRSRGIGESFSLPSLYLVHASCVSQSSPRECLGPCPVRVSVLSSRVPQSSPRECLGPCLVRVSVLSSCVSQSSPHACLSPRLSPRLMRVSVLSSRLPRSLSRACLSEGRRGRGEKENHNGLCCRQE